MATFIMFQLKYALKSKPASTECAAFFVLHNTVLVFAFVLHVFVLKPNSMLLLLALGKRTSESLNKLIHGNY